MSEFFQGVTFANQNVSPVDDAVLRRRLVSDGVLRGSGRMGAFMAGTFTDLVLRVVLAAVLASALGSVGIWCAWPVGWTVSTAVSLGFSLRAFPKTTEQT